MTVVAAADAEHEGRSQFHTHWQRRRAVRQNSACFISAAVTDSSVARLGRRRQSELIFGVVGVDWSASGAVCGELQRHGLIGAELGRLQGLLLQRQKRPRLRVQRHASEARAIADNGAIIAPAIDDLRVV